MLRKIITLSILAVIFLLVFSCNDFKKEDFSVEGLDKQATSILNDTTVVPIGLAAKDVTEIDTSWHGPAVFSNANVIIDSLNNSNLTLVSGTDVYSVNVSADTTYLSVSTSTSSLIVYSTNYARMAVIRANGNIVTPTNVDILMELVYECPDVKVRAEYQDLDSAVLLRFVKGEQFSGSSMKMLLLKN